MNRYAGANVEIALLMNVDDNVVARGWNTPQPTKDNHVQEVLDYLNLQMLQKFRIQPDQAQEFHPDPIKEMTVVVFMCLANSAPVMSLKLNICFEEMTLKHKNPDNQSVVTVLLNSIPSSLEYIKATVLLEI